MNKNVVLIIYLQINQEFGNRNLKENQKKLNATGKQACWLNGSYIKQTKVTNCRPVRVHSGILVIIMNCTKFIYQNGLENIWYSAHY